MLLEQNKKRDKFDLKQNKSKIKIYDLEKIEYRLIMNVYFKRFEI